MSNFREPPHPAHTYVNGLPPFKVTNICRVPGCCKRSRTLVHFSKTDLYAQRLPCPMDKKIQQEKKILLKPLPHVNSPSHHSYF